MREWTDTDWADYLEGCDDGLRQTLLIASDVLESAAKAYDQLPRRTQRKLPFELTAGFLRNEAGRCRDIAAVHRHPPRSEVLGYGERGWVLKDAPAS